MLDNWPDRATAVSRRVARVATDEGVRLFLSASASRRARTA
jgi:hypothetical protein